MHLKIEECVNKMLIKAASIFTGCFEGPEPTYLKKYTFFNYLYFIIFFFGNAIETLSIRVDSHPSSYYKWNKKIGVRDVSLEI